MVWKVRGVSGQVFVFPENEELKKAFERYITNVIGNNCGLWIITEPVSESDVKSIWKKVLEAGNTRPLLFIRLTDSFVSSFKLLEFVSSFKLLEKVIERGDIWRPIDSKVAIAEILKNLIRQERKITNPFNELEQKYGEIKKWFNNSLNLEQDCHTFLSNMRKVEASCLVRAEIGHAEGTSSDSFQKSVKLQIYDLLRANVLRKEQKLKVLFIDNYPIRELKTIDERFKGIINGNKTLQDVLIKGFKLIDSQLYIRDSDFKKLYTELEKKVREPVSEDTVIPCEEIKDNGAIPVNVSLKDLDMALIDVALGERQEVDGIDFVNILRELRPELPAFILSMHTDYAIVKSAFSRGCDFYIPKNQVFSIPYVYDAYIDEIGEVVRFIKEKELRRSLLGNIRYWHFKKQFLWFGDKCYHMIDHGFAHAKDNWEMTNNILPPLLRSGILKEKYKCEVNSDELIYAFSMAIWLHDIGHKGNRHYGEPHLIRDTHGIISGELILSQGHYFGIKEVRPKAKEFNAFYENLIFPVGDQRKPVTQLLLEQLKRRRTDKPEKNKQEKRLTITEMIALFSIYHKGNTPLTEKDYYNLKERGKFIPLDLFENSDRTQPIIPLERILVEIGDDEFSEHFLALVALFRFIDGIDIHITRVGDPNEEALKKWVIQRDLEYNLDRLKELVRKMALQTSKELQPLFVKNFYLDVREKIENGASLAINRLANEFRVFFKSYEDAALLEEYLMLVNYCYFLKAQPGHFKLHAAVEKINVQYIESRSFCFTLYTPHEKGYLEKHKIFEVGKEEETLYGRLIDENRCYILRELNEGERYLKNFIKYVEIKLKSSSTHLEIGKPVSWPSK